MFSLITTPSTSVIFSAYTTFTASSMLVRTVLNDVQNIGGQIVPSVVQEKMLSILGGLMGNQLHQMSLVIDQYNGSVLNDIYVSSEAYLSTIMPHSVGQLKAFKGSSDTDISLLISKGEKIVDVFEGIQVIWEMISVESQKTSFDCEILFSSEQVERKSFVLNFNRKDKDIVLRSYLPYIMEKWKAIKEQKQVIKLYSIGSFYGDINLDHPSTFDTLAMDPMLKKEVIDDLDRFVKRRDYYRRVGKAWKRGYLLYGPPGTGKSSTIAAMANYLKFDIYELELTSLQNNSDLKRTLVSTANRSILVIEDIDCSAELKNRQDEDYNQSNKKLTLSGLLNFIDGLWSSCGDERIIVFTTNHKDRLDPALLRPGRMDVHIHMSYCTPSGFEILASNYLGIKNHILFSMIKKLVAEVEATPAEIAEQLMKSEAADVSLAGLVKFLEDKKVESSEATGGGGIVEDADYNVTGNDVIAKEIQKKRVKKSKKNKRNGKRKLGL